MGKKKVALLGEETTVSEKEKKPAKKTVQTPNEPDEAVVPQEAEKVTKKAKKAVVKIRRSQRYKNARAKVQPDQQYPIAEAIKLAQETSLSRFEGKIELHLTVREGTSGEIVFPHETGKTQRIAIATDEILANISKGETDFDVLLASPEMMKKLAPLARVLGPKGLMPNPKKGTITTEPEKVAKLMAGKTRFETEKKTPLIHLVIGTTSQAATEVIANAEAVIKTVGPTNIIKAVVSATMGPGVKITL